MERFHLKYEPGCNYCEVATCITEVREGNHVPCILFNSINANTEQFDDLFNKCAVFSNESLFDAIETIKDALDLLEFVVLYENEAIYHKFNQIVSSTFEDNGEEIKEGKLWIRHRLVNQIVLGQSFIEWFSSLNKANKESFHPDPFRIHLFVISEFNSAKLIKILQLIYSQIGLIGFYIPLLCYNNTTFDITKNSVQLDPKEQNLSNEYLILKHCLKLCIVLKHENYYIGSYVLIVIYFRIQLLSRRLISLRSYFQSLEIKYYFDGILMRHFGLVWKIYNSIIFETEYNHGFSSFVKNEHVIRRSLCDVFMSPSVMDKDMFYNYFLEDASQLCLECEGPIVDSVCKDYYWPVLWSLLKEYNLLAEECWTLARENPLLAIEKLRDTMGSIEFDVLYENNSDKDQISTDLCKWLQNDCSLGKVGTLHVPHIVRKEFVLNCSTLDWIRENEKKESISLSPYRIHLIVVNEGKYTRIQQRNLIEFIYRKRGFKEGIFIPLLFIDINEVETNSTVKKEYPSQDYRDNAKIILINCIYKYCIVFKDKMCYFGRHTFQMLTFQNKFYLDIIAKILMSLNYKKCQMEMNTLDKILTLLINELLLLLKFENSRVFELRCLDESNSIEEERIDYKIEEVKLKICDYIPWNSKSPYKNSSNKLYIFMKFVCHLFNERASFFTLINFLQSLWFAFIVPLVFLNKCNMYISANQSLSNFKLKIANSTFLDLLEFPNSAKVLSDMIILVINHFDRKGETKLFTIKTFKKIPNFNILLDDFQFKIKTVMEERSSNSLITRIPLIDTQYEIGRECAEYIDRRWKTELNEILPKEYQQMFFEIFKSDPQAIAQNDQSLYDVYCFSFQLVRTLACSFILKNNSVRNLILDSYIYSKTAY